jgi:hexokinase
MIKALKEERGIEKMAVHNAGHSQSGRGTPIFGGSTPEALSGDESSSAAARARAHRDKLLAFQRENAQRTKVHDEAADYDVSLAPGTTQWMTPVQRAAALKKQQQYIREMEEANRPEWEKKKTVMSMSIKNGKLVKTFERQKAPMLAEADRQGPAGDARVDTEHDDGADQHLSVGGKGAFSNNPLLVSGKLVRPVWKAPEGAEKAKGREVERKSVWRRVQDENEDNEQWILDGGLHGYGTETRSMEDGSQQECG